MKSTLKILSLLLIFLFHHHAFAESLADRMVNGIRLFDALKNQGVPETALQRALTFMDLNAGKTIQVKAKIRPKDDAPYIANRNVSIKSDYLAIIDFSQSSVAQRLYVMNLNSGTVDKYFVAHGRGSGVRIARKFSNIEGSKMSSLGFYLGGSPYYGGHGESMSLYGLEKSNDQAVQRDVVMHGADYVSQDFINLNGRLGRSWGCPAVNTDVISKLINLFKDGGVIYAFQNELMATSYNVPTLQRIADQTDDPDIDLPNEEEDFQAQRN